VRKIILATTVLLAFLVGTLLDSALARQIERPQHSSDHHYQLPPRVENCSTDGKASVGLGVNPWRYAECDTPEGYDTIRLNVTMTTNTRMHITYNYIEGDLYWIPADPAIDTVLSNVGDDVGFWIDLSPPSGEDVIREVFILKEDVAVTNYQACFMLREGWPGLNFSESVIDQVKLYAVDAYGNRYLCPLIKATHSTAGNVLLKLLLSDNWKTKMLLLETIDLTFAVPYPTSQTQAYVFVIEGCNMLKQ